MCVVQLFNVFLLTSCHYHVDSLYSCNFCDQKFDTKKSLMVHKKREHMEKVAVCWSLWVWGWLLLVHPKQKFKQTEIFNCNIHEQDFNRKMNLQHHKKNEHIMSVPLCRNESKHTCCVWGRHIWFRNLETYSCNQQNLLNQNQEITAKVFDMMETFTKRILQIENQMEMTDH